jgi:hypothetical protein
VCRALELFGLLLLEHIRSLEVHAEYRVRAFSEPSKWSNVKHRKNGRSSARPAKERSRRTLKRKGRNVPKPHHSSPSPREMTRLTRERDDALDQHAATAEVMRVISSSPGNLDAAF